MKEKAPRQLPRPIEDKPRRLRHVPHNLLLLLVGAVAMLPACAPAAWFHGISLFSGAPLLVAYVAGLRFQKETHPASIFLFGLLHDVLSGGIIGFWALLYLLFYALLLTQPRSLLHFAQRSLLFSWLGFLLASLLFALLLALAGALLVDGGVSWTALAAQWLLSAAFSPLFLLRRSRPPHPPIAAAQG